MAARLGLNDIAMGIVLVIMVVGINCYLWWSGGAQCLAKQGEIGRVVGHLLRMPFAAHVLIEANDGISSGHN